MVERTVHKGMIEDSCKTESELLEKLQTLGIKVEVKIMRYINPFTSHFHMYICDIEHFGGTVRYEETERSRFPGIVSLTGVDYEVSLCRLRGEHIAIASISDRACENQFRESFFGLLENDEDYLAYYARREARLSRCFFFQAMCFLGVIMVMIRFPSLHIYEYVILVFLLFGIFLYGSKYRVIRGMMVE